MMIVGPMAFVTPPPASIKLIHFNRMFVVQICILLFFGQQAQSCRPEDIEDNIRLNDIVIIIVIHLNKYKTLNAIHSTLLFLNHLYNLLLTTSENLNTTYSI